MKNFVAIFIFILLNNFIIAQNDSVLKSRIDELNKIINDYEHRFDILERIIDDQLFYTRLGDIAFVDKVFIYGEPPAKSKNPEKLGAFNPVKFWAYVFIPKNINLKKKYPLIVFPHGGVHANFSTYYVHILKELLVQGYVVVAPEY